MSKHLGSRAVVFTLVVIASFALEGRAQMLGCIPGQPCGGPIPADVVLTKEDYMRVVLQRWTPSQVAAWQALAPSYRDWVAALMWRRQQIKDIEKRNGRPVSTHYDPYARLDMPSNCQLPPFVEPMRNPSDLIFQSSLRSYPTAMGMAGSLPSLMGTPVEIDGWDQWVQIEPTFRAQAEGEMYEQHYQLLWVRARLAWWQANAATIESCIEANRAAPLTQEQSVTFASEVVNDNRAIDAKWDRIIKGVRDAFAPRPEKPEKIESLEGMREIEKYEHDMDRSEKPEPSPSPHENSHTD